MTLSGLSSIWDEISKFLRVDISISQDLVPNAKYPAIIKFVVTNTFEHEEFQTDVLFEEVQLKVGMPPNWHVEKVENFSIGQSFSYEHHCNYDEIMKVQWALEGRVSPALLLTFHVRPSNLNRNRQLPVKAYFDFLEHMNIHKWLEQIKSFSAPTQDTTLADMKSKERALNALTSELMNSKQQLQDFLGLIDYDRARDDILQYRKAVEEYLTGTQREIGDLIQRLTNHDTQGFGKTRDRIVTKLSDRASTLDKFTEDLGQKLGILTKVVEHKTLNLEASKIGTPPAIPLREIDLHGNHNIEEAIPMLQDFIKESYRDNVRVIRIVHGKGIGVLRDAVRTHLESHKLVKSVSSADKDHGGEGATEAQLVDYNMNLL